MLIFQKSACSGCCACVSACPKKCISMQQDNEGFLYPSIDDTQCIQCGLCEKVCPVLNKYETTHQPIAYAVQNKDEKIREESSSGGFFTLLAEYIIGQGGIVFGAAFNGNFEVSHIAIDNKDDLGKLRGSKYVQSRIGDTYKEAKKYLEEGRYVLFSGTPCQVQGLLKYLGKEYEKLITQDIICHGTPSPFVWKTYLKDHEAKAGSKIQKVVFRYKKYGWKSFSMYLEFSNGTKYEKTHTEDTYMRCFLADLCLRPSCYECNFKDKMRASDFTLADLWGVSNIIPEFDDNKGTSLVLVNSEKGRNIFTLLTEYIRFDAVDVDQAIRFNSAMIKSVEKPAKRDTFMVEIIKQPFDKLVWCMLHKPLWYRFAKKVKNCLRYR